MRSRLRPLLVATLSLGLGGCASGAAARPEPEAAPVTDAALAVPQGEVERATFAEELHVVLLAMTRLPTGIYFRDVEEGSGRSAAPGREVLVHYIAYLPDGRIVDELSPPAQPLAFKVGDGVVIRGWDLGVRGMKVGGTRQLVVPSRYAYGARGTAKVPPDTPMVFLVRLDGVR